MTTKITDSQFDILMEYYDDPDASLRPFLGLLNPNVAYQLENKGYITDDPSARGCYVLTPSPWIRTVTSGHGESITAASWATGGRNMPQPR